ncbi:ERAD-associated E3 ubiquitin-protein ligase doa10 [Schizosaccharomyces pombe]
MNADDEICRVCRCEGAPDSPLFHPCKCTGSIRYVHQECLVEWLGHSKKTHCELCKAKFEFTKVYSESMPRTIPFTILCRKLASTLKQRVIFFTRVLLTFFCWTVLLPLIFKHVWNLNFKIGDTYTIHARNKTFTAPQKPGYFESISQITSSPRLNTLIANTAEGQVLTFVVTFILITAFLVREWVLQNAVQVADELQGQQFENVNQNNQAQAAAAAAQNLREVREARQRLAMVMEHLRERQEQRNLELQRNGSFEEIERARQRFALLGDNIREPQEEENDVDVDEIFNRQQLNQPALDLNDANSSNSVPVEFNSLHSQNVDYRDEVDSLRPQFNVDEQSSISHSSNASENIVDGAVTQANGIESDFTRVDHEPIIVNNDDENGNNESENEEVIEEDNLNRNVIAEAQNQVVADEERNAVARAAQIAEADDADDFDGILEFLGLRGPITGFLQNCLVIAFVVSVFLTTAVGIPYMSGRLMVEWILFIIHRPTFILRFILSFVNILFDWTVGGAFNIVKILTKLPLLSTVFVKLKLQGIFSSSFQQVSNNMYSWIYDHVFSSSDHAYESLIYYMKTGHKQVVQSFSIFPVFRVCQMFAVILKDFVENYSNRPVDRVFTTLIGYCMFTFLGISYLNRKQFLFNDPQIRNVELAFREVLRQCGSIAKFGIIFSIELVVFPIFCGILLSMCLIGTFKKLAAENLLNVMTVYPAQSIFLAWFIGITFMFEFAVFISMVRKIVRPGVLYFLRDPNDPQFHPIREILEKPMLFQLKKIGFSAILYFAFIIGCVGSVIHLLKSTGIIFPIEFTTKPAVFEAPIDLLALEILIFLSIKLFKPLELTRSFWRTLVSTFCRCLRLSSYVMGQRYSDEEGYYPKQYFSFLRRIISKPSDTENQDDGDKQKAKKDFVQDGFFLWCPSKDVVPVRQGAMLIPVTENGYEIFGEKKKVEENADYTITYAPSNFYKRLIALLLFCWICSTLVTVLLVFVPLSLGRAIYAWCFPNVVKHDFYAYAIGFYSISFPMYAIHASVKFLKLDYLRSLMNKLNLKIVMRSLVMALKYLLLAFLGIFILPLLLGAIWELYVAIPFRTIFNRGTLALDAFQNWVIGLFMLRMIYFTATSNEERFVSRLFQDAFRDRWTNPQILPLLKNVLIPFTSALIAAVVLPSVFTYVTYPFLSSIFPSASKTLMYRLMHPIFLALLGLALLGRRFVETSSKWSQGIRDDLYLVGTRLHNFGESAPPAISESAEK